MQLRHLSQYLDVRLSSDSYPTVPSSQSETIEHPLFAQFEREGVQRLLFGLFCLGIVSCAVSSKLLLDHTVHSLGPIFSWVMFLTFWGAIVLQVQARPLWSPVWGMGALLTLLLFLWPTLIVAQDQSTDLLWLFWCGSLLFGIAVVPWRMRELVPLCLVICTIAAELSHRLLLTPEQFLGLIVLAGGAGVLSLQARRVIHERCLFRHVAQNLMSCDSERAVLRFFAQTGADLLHASIAVLPTGGTEVEIVRGGSVTRQRSDRFSLRELAANTAIGHPIPDTSRFRIIRWLPEGLPGLPDILPGVDVRHGLLVEDLGRAAEASPHAGPAVDALPILFVTVVPLFEFFIRRRLAIACLCRDACALRLAALREAEDARRVAETADQQAIQREYELGTLVHDINNTVQDMTLLCESILERMEGEEQQTAQAADDTKLHGDTISSIERIAAIARSVATVVSDAKRRKELEKLEDLTPRELVEVKSVIADLIHSRGSAPNESVSRWQTRSCRNNRCTSESPFANISRRSCAICLIMRFSTRLPEERSMFTSEPMIRGLKLP